MLFKRLALISILALTTSEIANAGSALSWNLSRDMIEGIAKNPNGVWTFMKNTTGVDNPVNYSQLSHYHSPCYQITPYLDCWHINKNNGIYPLVGIATKTFKYRGITETQGIPLFHPGANSPVILRWKSPIDGNVSVMGRVSAFDQNCNGDGINWAFKDKNAVIIKSGHLNNCTGHVFSAENIAVIKGDSLYFSIDMNGTTYNDSTNLDMLITSQQ
ncbi:MAG: hypothetical protein WAX77_14930 [Methylococcaceae bacterium]